MAITFSTRNVTADGYHANKSPSPELLFGFGKFVEYRTRRIAEGLVKAFPICSEAFQ